MKKIMAGKIDIFNFLTQFNFELQRPILNGRIPFGKDAEVAQW